MMLYKSPFDLTDYKSSRQSIKSPKYGNYDKKQPFYGQPLFAINLSKQAEDFTAVQFYCLIASTDRK